MNRQSEFSYVCNACGRCCHNKVITLSPADVSNIARAAEVSTAEVVERFTFRRGSLLRFTNDGACAALDGTRCSIHHGRPLSCRLYPLGIERAPQGDHFIELEPAAGSAGVYGTNGTVADFIRAEGVDECMATNDRYHPLIAIFRARITELVDFEKTEPREFWRHATREALAESGYDANEMIDALFDPDRFGTTVPQHVDAITTMARASLDAAGLAAAAVLLAVSLGYSPSIVFATK